MMQKIVEPHVKGSPESPLLWVSKSHEMISASLRTSRTGLKVFAEKSDSVCQTGVKVSDSEMKELNIAPAAFRPEWNYTISPSPLVRRFVKLLSPDEEPRWGDAGTLEDVICTVADNGKRREESLGVDPAEIRVRCRSDFHASY